MAGSARSCGGTGADWIRPARACPGAAQRGQPARGSGPL